MWYESLNGPFGTSTTIIGTLNNIADVSFHGQVSYCFSIFFFIKSASDVVFSTSNVFLPSLLHCQLQFLETDNVK